MKTPKSSTIIGMALMTTLLFQPVGNIAADNSVAICHNGHTIMVSPQGAENHLRNHPGDTLGPCEVTPVQNL